MPSSVICFEVQNDCRIIPALHHFDLAVFSDPDVCIILDEALHGDFPCHFLI